MPLGVAMGVGFNWTNQVGKEASNPRPLFTSIMVLIVSLVLGILTSRPCYGGGFQVDSPGRKRGLGSEASLHKHLVLVCVARLENYGLSVMNLVFVWFSSLEDSSLSAVHLVFDWFTGLEDSGHSAVHLVFDWYM